MMKFLDALYVVSCNFYKKREAEMFKISGLILLTTVFSCNLVLITFLLPEYFNNISSSKIYSSRYIIVVVTMATFIILLYLRYFRITNYDDVKSKLDSTAEGFRIMLFLTAIIYIIMSFVTMIGYAVYLGYK